MKVSLEKIPCIPISCSLFCCLKLPPVRQQNFAECVPASSIIQVPYLLMSKEEDSDFEFVSCLFNVTGPVSSPESRIYDVTSSKE